MLGVSRFFYMLKLAAPIMVSLWCFGYFFASRDAYRAALRPFKNQKSLYVADFLEHEIDGSFDGSGIAELCARQTWTPNLYLSCEPVPGGLGQVKNGLLTCIRVGIEMGAELILPRIIKRSDTDIKKTRPSGGNGPIKSIPLDYFFDFDHFNHSLSTFCPQMKTHPSLDALYDKPNLLTAIRFRIEDMGIPRVNGVMGDTPTVSQKFQEFIAMRWPKEKRATPTRFNLEWTWFTWPTIMDKPDVSRNFGRILQIREDARRLAASALFKMQKLFGVNLDPRSGIRQETFLGVHLRTELDGSGEFPPYETQAAHYLDYITETRVPLVYMATGATYENVTAFTTRAEDFNVTVVRKVDVLEGGDLDLLEKLTWDQKALVDYEIMLRAGLVVGPSQSSFSWNLAMRRRNAYGGHGLLEQDHPNAKIQWQDKYSTIFGKSEKGAAMMKTIWP